MIVESFLAFLSRIFCFASFVGNKGTFPEPLEPNEEKRLLVLSKTGDMEARETLITHNLRLVAHVVKKFSNAGEADDLISIGTIGLIKGIETYEFGHSCGLATYCGRCIQNEILMHIRCNKKNKCTASLFESVGTDKDGNEIALIDVLAAKQESVENKIEIKMLYEAIVHVIESVLSDRDKDILKKRYGIGMRAMTQLQIAKELNISRSYVSRIEKRAILKVAREIRSKPLYSKDIGILYDC
ncbi:MAG: RNA polymerase sporulation sigma factor SigK [Firmicutes bacterium]|nr:RNA polymerase sporulation sigma factor SigK [Bacillota bacterium]